jgi:preprotein translocase subunit SecG
MIVIVACIVGAAIVITLALVTRGRSRKFCANMSDRDLIEARIRSQGLARTLFIIRFLLILLFAFVCMDHLLPDGGVALLIVFVCVCVGLRGTFKNMRVTSEAELEFRKLQSSSESGDKTVRS